MLCFNISCRIVASISIWKQIQTIDIYNKCIFRCVHDIIVFRNPPTVIQNLKKTISGNYVEKEYVNAALRVFTTTIGRLQSIVMSVPVSANSYFQKFSLGLGLLCVIVAVSLKFVLLNSCKLSVSKLLLPSTYCIDIDITILLEHCIDFANLTWTHLYDVRSFDVRTHVQTGATPGVLQYTRRL